VGLAASLGKKQTTEETTTDIEDVKFEHGNFMKFSKGDLYKKYKLSKKLGCGAFSSVRRAKERTTGADRAIKTLRRSKMSHEINIELFKNEVSLLRKMDHPHILKIYDLIEDSKYYHIVTELCTGGELFDYIVNSEGISEATAAHIMKQILGVVSYCHRNNIVHRDLKPENLLLVKPNDLTIKVIDFGTSALIDPT
jgi:calcium-dependent protein kinase